MNVAPRTVVGFTGHRHLVNPEAVRVAIEAELKRLRDQSRDVVGCSSIASGSDMLFAEECRSLGIGWRALLPFSLSEFSADFAPDEWERVEELLRGATDVQVTGSADDREEAYLGCGRKTVESSDCLLAVWDGKPARGKGGTADIVGYAQSIGKPVIIIHADGRTECG